MSTQLFQSLLKLPSDAEPSLTPLQMLAKDLGLDLETQSQDQTSLRSCFLHDPARFVQRSHTSYHCYEVPEQKMLNLLAEAMPGIRRMGIATEVGRIFVAKFANRSAFVPRDLSVRVLKIPEFFTEIKDDFL